MTPTDESAPRPVPDPIALATEQLLREITSLERLIGARVDGVVGALDERFKGLEAIVDERFKSVEKQFDIVEAQRIEQKQDTKTAVDAALQAQKEAVREQTNASERANAKTEAATTKSTDQLSETFNTAIEGIRREISDLKERVGKIA